VPQSSRPGDGYVDLGTQCFGPRCMYDWVAYVAAYQATLTLEVHHVHQSVIETERFKMYAPPLYVSSKFLISVLLCYSISTSAVQPRNG
jgi:hypothetical protein